VDITDDLRWKKMSRFGALALSKFYMQNASYQNQSQSYIPPGPRRYTYRRASEVIANKLTVRFLPSEVSGVNEQPVLRFSVNLRDPGSIINYLAALMASTHRHGCLNSLDIAFVHEYFSSSCAESLHLALFEVLASLQSFDLFIQIAH